MSSSPDSLELRESTVKAALERLSWSALQKHLDDVRLDPDSLSELLGHLQRSSRLIAKYRDAARQAKRDALLQHLVVYVDAKLGQEARDRGGDRRWQSVAVTCAASDGSPSRRASPRSSACHTPCVPWRASPPGSQVICELGRLLLAGDYRLRLRVRQGCAFTSGLPMRQC
jgi:hypothetical protein